MQWETVGCPMTSKQFVAELTKVSAGIGAFACCVTVLFLWIGIGLDLRLYELKPLIILMAIVGNAIVTTMLSFDSIFVEWKGQIAFGLSIFIGGLVGCGIAVELCFLFLGPNQSFFFS